MYRNVLSALAVSAAAIAIPASGQSGDRSYHFPMPPSAPFNTVPTATIPSTQTVAPLWHYVPNKWQARQLVRWGEVGKCVAAKDHDGSLSYIAAMPGSPMASVAAKRLDPAFAACLTGSGIVQKGNKGYRRAALADAFGVRLPAG